MGYGRTGHGDPGRGFYQHLKDATGRMIVLGDKCGILLGGKFLVLRIIGGRKGSYQIPQTGNDTVRSKDPLVDASSI